MNGFTFLAAFSFAILEFRPSSCCRNDAGRSTVVTNVLSRALEDRVERQALHTYGALRGINDAIVMPD